jgi:hypothetical protein
MAYVDNNLVLGGSIAYSGGTVTITGQSIVGTNTSVLSTNVIDLASGGIPSGQTRDMGSGADYDYLRTIVTTAFAGATSVEFQAIQHDDTAQSTNVTVVGTTGAVLLANLTLGARLVAQINPRIGSKGQRYMSGRFVIVGAGSAGTAFVDIGAEFQDGQKFYPNGFAVL